MENVAAEIRDLEGKLRGAADSTDFDALARLAALYEQTASRAWGGDRRSRVFKKSPALSVAERLAKLTKQSARAVRRKLLIAEKGTPTLKAAVVEGKLSQNFAVTLLNLDAEAQDKNVALMVSTGVRRLGLREKRRRLFEDEDFVDLPEFDYSVKMVCEEFPGGIDGELLDRALVMMTKVDAETFRKHPLLVKKWWRLRPPL